MFGLLKENPEIWVLLMGILKLKEVIETFEEWLVSEWRFGAMVAIAFFNSRTLDCE